MSRRLNVVGNLCFFLIILMMGGITVGCGSGIKDVRVTLLPTYRLNPDESGAPLSVVVRVYQLRNRERFDRADFRALWRNDEKELAGDLLERREVTVYPETKTSIELQVDQRFSFWESWRCSVSRKESSGGGSCRRTSPRGFPLQPPPSN